MMKYKQNKTILNKIIAIHSWSNLWGFQFKPTTLYGLATPYSPEISGINKAYFLPKWKKSQSADSVSMSIHSSNQENTMHTFFPIMLGRLS